MSESNSIVGYAANVRVQATGFRQARGVATASIALISAYIALDAVAVALVWRFSALVDGYMRGTGSTLEEAAAVQLYLGIALFYEYVTFLLAGIVFLFWARRARINAALMSGPDASSRRRSVSTAIVLWAAMSANTLLGVIGRITEPASSDYVVDHVYRGAVLPTVSLAFGIIAAVLIGVIIARIRVWQEPYPTNP